MSAGRPACPVCPGCGSSNIVDDDLYAQAQRVCVDCGSVVSEGLLANDPVGGSDVSYSWTTAVAKKPCANLVKGRTRLKAICRTLRVHGEIEDLSLTHYNRAYEHESFLKVSLQKKEILAGCCVLVSCRLLNWPVTMGTISCLLDADPNAVGVVYQEVVQALRIEAPVVNIGDVIEAHAQEYKISSLHVPEELAESCKALTERATALVELAAETWIVTGRKPVPVIMAAVFLAWQSLRPGGQRLKLSLEKFCRLAKVKKQNPALQRVAEMKAVLCRLAGQIPWVRGHVTPDNVAQHVGDILRHRHALLWRALRNHQEALQEAGTREDQTRPESAAPATQSGEIAGGADGTDGITVVDGDAGAEQAGGEERPAAPGWGKKLLFAPPCVIHPKKRRLEPRRQEDVTGDEEISDGEIESYIRTPAEARDFARVQKMLSQEGAGGS